MSEVIRLKCDNCDYIQGEKDYSYRPHSWLRIWGAFLASTGNETPLNVTVGGDGPVKDFCRNSCFEAYVDKATEKAKIKALTPEEPKPEETENAGGTVS